MNKSLQSLIHFRKARDWEQFHTPLNLAISLQLEISEVLEKFQWKTNEEFIKNYQNNPNQQKAMQEEIADVYSYLLLLAHSLDIDLDKALEDKIKQNEAKYPIHKARGNAKKYTEL